MPRYFLVRKGTKDAFELGADNWPRVFNGMPIESSSKLFQDITVLSTLEGWLVQPSYVLWLSDKLIEFIGDNEVELDARETSINQHDLVVISTRFVNGAEIKDYIVTRYA